MREDVLIIPRSSCVARASFGLPSNELQIMKSRLTATFLSSIVSSQHRKRRFSTTRTFRSKWRSHREHDFALSSFMNFTSLFMLMPENRRRKWRRYGFVSDNRSCGYANFNGAAHTEERATRIIVLRQDSNEESTLPMNSYRSFRIN